MQKWPNLREICRICAKFAQKLRKFAQLCEIVFAKVAQISQDQVLMRPDATDSAFCIHLRSRQRPLDMPRRRFQDLEIADLRFILK